MHISEVVLPEGFAVALWTPSQCTFPEWFCKATLYRVAKFNDESVIKYGTEGVKGATGKPP